MKYCSNCDFDLPLYDLWQNSSADNRSDASADKSSVSNKKDKGVDSPFWNKQTMVSHGFHYEPKTEATFLHPSLRTKRSARFSGISFQSSSTLRMQQLHKSKYLDRNRSQRDHHACLKFMAVVISSLALVCAWIMVAS